MKEMRLVEEEVRGRDALLLSRKDVLKLHAAADDDDDCDYYPKIAHPNLTYLSTYTRPFICECVII
jgi:hypothetical protein